MKPCSQQYFKLQTHLTRGVISTFSWGANFFIFFNATGLLKNWKKQHFICSNLTLFIVPFFLFSLFSLFFLFFLSFFLIFLLFLFPFSWWEGRGATVPQPPPMTPLHLTQLTIVVGDLLSPSCGRCKLLYLAYGGSTQLRYDNIENNRA